MYLAAHPQEQTIHMIGIGGAGMAAQALMLKEMGYTVTGSDHSHSDNTRRLEEAGIAITYSHDPHNVDGADLCVHSAAIPADHPQLQYAREHMPVITRAQLMGELTARFNTVVAVAGTHGKTTTSSLITHVLLEDGRDPSAQLGGFLTSIGGNGKLGGPDVMVVEACEFAGTFLELKRDVGILLNVDRDHLECYGSMEGLRGAFAKFCDACATALVCGDDAPAMQVTQHHPHRLTFGIDGAWDYTAADLTQERGFYRFTLCKAGRPLTPVVLRVPGRHNVLNALAAAAACDVLGVSPAAIAAGIGSFPGVARRFEILLHTPELTIADDYAHHPAEIEAVLNAAAGMGFSRVTAVFQPFTFSRTSDLKDEFIRVLKLADRVILAPIMGGREKDPGTIRSEDLAAELPGAVVCPDLSACAREALAHRQAGELIITMGCGNVYYSSREMVRRLAEQKD